MLTIISVKVMNLNEYCLLNFLINPDEIKDLTGVFIKNIEEIENSSLINNNYKYEFVYK